MMLGEPTNNLSKYELKALIRTVAFDYSGFDGKVLESIVYYHKSFVSCHYKAWAQMSLFLIGPYILDAQKDVQSVSPRFDSAKL